MKLSEDAVAIVAANLTAAVCALAGPRRPEPGQPHNEDAVDDLFRRYCARISKGLTPHDHTPSG